jgi:hypothetical protein
MGRKSASGSGMNNPDHIFKSLETIFLIFWGLKYLNSLMRIRDADGKKSDPGSGINIPDPLHYVLLTNWESVSNGAMNRLNEKQ